jgi:GNAT superfamily N-acetyltransferase
MQIRELEPKRDAAAVTELVREVNPTATINVAASLHRMESAPPRSRGRAWVAEVDGRVVGRSEAFLHPFNEGSARGYVLVAVTGAHRLQGIGAALYDVAFAHAVEIGTVIVQTDFYENPEGVRFAEERGFRFARAEQALVLDPRDVHEPPPADVDLRPVRAIDPHDLHLVDETATRDMPQLEVIESIPYDEWEQHVLEHPLFTLDGSFVAYVDDEPAACSMILVDLESGRASNMMTGVVPWRRGRGLGLACKLASIRWAAENGITLMATSNDEANAPMLAINERLGYEPAGRRVEFERAV